WEELWVFLGQFRERRRLNNKGELGRNQLFLVETADLRSTTII
ncbi:MAG: hypothetical protein RLZZ176_1399, partial [Cyanobacteriota bacterium]